MDSHDTIFVSVASYRDPECSTTLLDLFTKASFPDRIYVGVCQQNDVGDPDCMIPALKPYQSRIRIIRMTSLEAEGPMYARHLIEQQLYKGEMFYLQIDSHMLFVPGWDQQCIHQLALCNSEKPILTTYPHDFDRLTRKFLVLPNGQKRPLNSVPPTFLRFREIHPRLKFTEQEKNIFAVFPNGPQPSLFWAAGFSFSLGQLVQEVPYDVHCPFLFVGEEQGLSMRYYTHGWDFFAPSVNIVYHLKMRTYRKTFWEQVYKKQCVVDDDTRKDRKHKETLAVKRIRALVAGKLNDPQYNLGTVRSIQDWEQFTGVNLRTLQASDRSVKGLSPNASPEEIQCKVTTTNNNININLTKTFIKPPSLKQHVSKVPVFGNKI